MQWGTLANIGDVLATGSPDVAASLELDGSPFSGPFRARAGEDGFLPSSATLRFVAPIIDGVVVQFDLSLPIEVFEAGYHPLQSFESYGTVRLADPISGHGRHLGVAGVELDEASLEPGGTIRGRLAAKASYFLCASRILALIEQQRTQPDPGATVEPEANEEPAGDDVPPPDAPPGPDGPPAPDAPPAPTAAE